MNMVNHGNINSVPNYIRRQEDNLTGRRNHRNLTSLEADITKRQPYKKTGRRPFGRLNQLAQLANLVLSLAQLSPSLLLLLLDKTNILKRTQTDNLKSIYGQYKIISSYPSHFPNFKRVAVGQKCMEIKFCLIFCIFKYEGDPNIQRRNP